MFFFFNDTATTEIYTLSLHDALPIYGTPPTPRAAHTSPAYAGCCVSGEFCVAAGACIGGLLDRKSTRLNSSHSQISYAVFCLKKKYHLDKSRKPTSACLSRSCMTAIS